MADTVQFIDGFESGNLKAWTTSLVSPLSGLKLVLDRWPQGIMDDTYYLYLDDNDYVRHSFTTDASLDCMVAFWYLPDQFVANQWVAAWYLNSTLVCHLRVDPTTHVLKMYRGTSTPFTNGAGSIAYALTLKERSRIYVHVVFGATETTANVYADGVHVIVDATDPTDNASAANVFQLGGTSAAVKGCYDNVVLGNLALDTRAYYHITAYQPLAAGSSTQWTPSAGANYECVQDIPGGTGSTSEHVGTNAVDQLDLYACEDLLDNKSYVGTWAQIGACFEVAGSPTPTNINLAYRTGAVTTHGADEAPVNLGCNTLIWQLADDGLDTYLDDLEIGIRSRA